MDNLITETNARLQEIVDNLTLIKEEYETKLKNNNDQIEVELEKVKKYKEDFFVSKQKIEKMNSDIEGFEADYKNLVERFKDDELANILIAANKEISAKIDERRKKIAKDKVAMNELVELAEDCKNRLVKLTAEKKALELCLAKILDSHEYYGKSLSQIIVYSEDHRDDLCSCFYEDANENPLEVDNKFTKMNDDDDVLVEDEEEDTIDLDDEVDEEEHNELENNDLKSEVISVIDLNDNIDDDDDIEEEELELDDDIEDEEVNEDEEDDSLDEDALEADLNITDDDTASLEDIKNEDNDDTNLIEDTNHTMEIENIPSSLYDLNDSLDLENLLGLDDELEDDESLYENEKED